MTELRTVFFRNAAGEVHPVRLPAIEAASACGRHPHDGATAPTSSPILPRASCSRKATAEVVAELPGLPFASIRSGPCRRSSPPLRQPPFYRRAST
jgi:hypothetical protein